MKRWIWISSILGGWVMAGCTGEVSSGEKGGAQSDSKDAIKDPNTGKSDALHAPFDKMLSAYVKDGWVSYKEFKKNESKLDEYLAALGRTDPSGLSTNDRLALWINAYNAYTIKLILRRYPGIKSIKDIPGRWDLADWTVGGKKYSLNDMEHKILRKDFAEPRIHFAIVCASKSCPDLVSHAYLGSKLDAQLTAATRSFLANTEKGLLARREKGSVWGHNNNVYLSKIFKWFSGDFKKKSGSVVAFVKPYLSEANRTFIDKHSDKLSTKYMDYSWTLNGE